MPFSNSSTMGASASTLPSFSQIVVNQPVMIIQKQDQKSGRQVSGLVSEILTKGDHPRGIKVKLSDGRIGRVQSLSTSFNPEYPSTPEEDYYEEFEDCSTNGANTGTTTPVTPTEGQEIFINNNGEVQTIPTNLFKRWKRNGYTTLDNTDDEGVNSTKKSTKDTEYDLSAFVKEGWFLESEEAKWKRQEARRRQAREYRNNKDKDREDRTCLTDSEAIASSSGVSNSKSSSSRRRREAAEGSGIGEASTSSQKITTCPVCKMFKGDEQAIEHHVAKHFES